MGCVFWFKYYNNILKYNYKVYSKIGHYFANLITSKVSALQRTEIQFLLISWDEKDIFAFFVVTNQKWHFVYIIGAQLFIFFLLFSVENYISKIKIKL